MKKWLLSLPRWARFLLRPKGSFSVRVPRVARARERAGGYPSVMAEPANFLIVDDDEDLRAMVSRVLRAEGQRFREAAHGQVALDTRVFRRAAVRA